MKIKSVLFAIICAFSATSSAEELISGFANTAFIANVNLTEAYEAEKIEVSLRMDGSVSDIYAKKCEGCPSEKFTASKDTTFFFGSRTLGADELVSFSGQSGTVVYYPKTYVLESILFFDLED